MNTMNKLCVAVFLVAVAAIVPVFNQTNPFGKGFDPFASGFPVPPNVPQPGSQGTPPAPPTFPKPGSQGTPKKLPSVNLPPGLRPRLPKICDLTVPKPTRDRSIVKTVDVDRNAGASAPRASDVQRAINSAAQRGGPDGQVVKGFLAAVRKIASSKARAASAGRSAAKARVPDRSGGQGVPTAAFLSPTTKTNMCTSVGKQIVTVRIGRQKCDTIAPQEVLNYECGSRFCKAPNPLPFLERYYCEPGNKVWTSWYVYCRKSQTIELHSAEISINCCCFRYSCNFAPYSATSPQKF